MKYWIPWEANHVDAHFFPNEEYQISRVKINDETGKEEVMHFSHGGFHELDSYQAFNNYMFGYIPLDQRDWDF